MASAYSEKKKEQSGVNREDIGGLMAELAGRQKPSDTPRRKLTGPERAAVLMLALGDHGGKIFGLLDDDELREISIVMSQLGTIDAESVEQLLLELMASQNARSTRKIILSDTAGPEGGASRSSVAAVASKNREK